MDILTNNPIDLLVELKGDRNLRSEDLFELARAIDEYEVTEATSEEVVVDITRITSDGQVTFRITPKKKITYKTMHDHLTCMIPRALKESGLDDFKFNLVEMVFETIHPGIASDIAKELEEIREVQKRLTNLEGEAKRRIEQSNDILLKVLEMEKGKN
jgi:hypothetical protein